MECFDLKFCQPLDVKPELRNQFEPTHINTGSDVRRKFLGSIGIVLVTDRFKKPVLVQSS